MSLSGLGQCVTFHMTMVRGVNTVQYHELMQIQMQMQIVVEMTTKDKYMAFCNAKAAKMIENADIEDYEPTQDDYADYFKGIPDLSRQLQHWIQIVKFYGVIPEVSISASILELSIYCFVSV